MTTEIDVDKIVTGELTQEDIEKLDKELTDEQKQAVVQKASAGFKDTLKSLNAIRKEKNRIETKNAELSDEARRAQEALDSYNSQKTEISQFRSEQLQKAKDKFKADFKLSDDEFAKVEAQFTRIDSGKIDQDLIYKDLRGSYAFLNSEELVKAKELKTSMERNASGAVSSEAGGSSVAPSNDSDSDSKVSPEAKALAKQAGISEESAERQIKEGNKRILM